jgi:hypothetical protein
VVSIKKLNEPEKKKRSLTSVFEFVGVSAIHQKSVKFSAIYEMEENKSDFTSHNELTTANNQLRF